MKKIVLTGGGTAGHISPNQALLPFLRQEGYEIHYVGNENSMEQRLMKEEPGVIFHAVKGGKLRRYFSWQNFIDPFKVIIGGFQSARLMGKLKPDVVFSKGGFVSVPVVFGAWLHRVPIVCHESDLTPGLANKICAKFAKKIATTFPECAKTLGEKGVFTGTPLREKLFTGDREKGLALAGFDGSKPVLMMMGGSQGAQRVNEALRAALDDILPWADVLHLCGKGNLDASLDGKKGYCQLEFLSDDLPDAMAAADFVLSRAGATALCELQALKKPMLLVPYPKGAGRGDQILNAQSYEKRGLCRVLLQENMTRETLTESLTSLWADRETIRDALNNAPAANGTQAVLALIHEVEKK